jgi:chemotaxis protein methyltransferase CheR
MGDWGKAGRSLKRSLYLKRDLAVGHYYLGLVQLSLGQEALRSFRNAQKIVRRQPDESPLLWGDGLTAGELRALLAPYLGEAIINGQ